MPAPKPINAGDMLDATLRILRAEVKRLRRIQSHDEKCEACGTGPGLSTADVDRLIKLTAELRQIERDTTAFFLNPKKLAAMSDAELEATLRRLAAQGDDAAIMALMARRPADG